jgi:hypothetical protein
MAPVSGISPVFIRGQALAHAGKAATQAGTTARSQPVAGHILIISRALEAHPLIYRWPNGWQDWPVSQADRVWQLVRGHELLAELVVTDEDFLWLRAEVRPAAGFAEVRPLFDNKLQRLDFLDEEPEQWEAVTASPAFAADRSGSRDGARPAAAGVDVAGRQLAYRQPSAGATWVRMPSMTWVL